MIIPAKTPHTIVFTHNIATPHTFLYTICGVVIRTVNSIIVTSRPGRAHGNRQIVPHHAKPDISTIFANS